MLSAGFICPVNDAADSFRPHELRLITAVSARHEREWINFIMRDRLVLIRYYYIRRNPCKKVYRQILDIVAIGFFL